MTKTLQIPFLMAMRGQKREGGAEKGSPPAGLSNGQFGIAYKAAHAKLRRRGVKLSVANTAKEMGLTEIDFRKGLAAHLKTRLMP